MRLELREYKHTSLIQQRLELKRIILHSYEIRVKENTNTLHLYNKD